MSAAVRTPAFSVLIPARMASSRLPDKPLADIAGLPMVVRVARQDGAARLCDLVGRHAVRVLRQVVLEVGRARGQQAQDEAWKMVRQTAWLYFDGGTAKVNPESLGIQRL